jgi:hypothetical protein
MPDVTAGATTTLGPGTLTIGAIGAAIDASCLVNNAQIKTDKSEDDPVYHLCGTATPGKVTYTHSLEGNLDIDPSEATGLFALSWDAMGTQQDFTFTPNTAEGTGATGTIVLDPLDFGADEYGATLNSDFAFTIVGTPTFTRTPVP